MFTTKKKTVETTTTNGQAPDVHQDIAPSARDREYFAREDGLQAAISAVKAYVIGGGDTGISAGDKMREIAKSAYQKAFAASVEAYRYAYSVHDDARREAGARWGKPVG